MSDKLTKKQAFWLMHLKAIREQGLAYTEYAKLHGLSLKALYNWATILRRKGVLEQADSATPFVEAKVQKKVSPESKPSLSQHITVRLPNGVSFDVPRLDLPMIQWLSSL